MMIIIISNMVILSLNLDITLAMGQKTAEFLLLLNLFNFIFKEEIIELVYVSTSHHHHAPYPFHILFPHTVLHSSY